VSGVCVSGTSFGSTLDDGLEERVLEPKLSPMDAMNRVLRTQRRIPSLPRRFIVDETPGPSTSMCGVAFAEEAPITIKRLVLTKAACQESIRGEKVHLEWTRGCTQATEGVLLSVAEEQTPE